MWQEVGALFRGYDLEVERYFQPGEGYIGPEPKRRFHSLLAVAGLLEHLVLIEPRQATKNELTRIHSTAYVNRIAADSAAGGGLAGPGTALARDSFEIAALSAGGVIAAVDAVLEGSVDNAYALVRPPGHHASRAEGRGLCVFANIAVAVAHLRETHGVSRVAVVDWDVHHGNGTQEIFYDDPNVLTISLHQANVPVGESTGSLDERGEGAGLGYNANIPLPPGSGRGAYMAALERIVVPLLQRFRPDFILIACGLDANALDPTGRMMLRPGAFRDMTQLLLATADELCDGRVVAAHEGGYSEFMAPFCGLAVVATLHGVHPDAERLFESLPLGGEPDQLLQPHQDLAVSAAEVAHLRA